jgi:hypothetical protein
MIVSPSTTNAVRTFLLTTYQKAADFPLLSRSPSYSKKVTNRDKCARENWSIQMEGFMDITYIKKELKVEYYLNSDISLPFTENVKVRSWINLANVIYRACLDELTIG